MLKIFNTITNSKENFISFNKDKVNIYVCGVTTSNYIHIGHGRTFYFFDILINYLKYLGYNCNYIRNITDIDNKIIYNSINNNISVKKLSEKIINSMFYDFNKLGLNSPNFEPKLTNNIKNIILSIIYLLNNNYAYISKNGDVLFSYNNFYNKYRIYFFKKKNDFSSKDFVLWKLNKYKDIYGWYSPWGFGRPGWHIGCSVISNFYLNNIIDIHGGGSDLIFPHHENELMLSKCLFGNDYFIKYWIHTGLVIIDDHKVSKSKDNFFLYKLLNKYFPEIIKYYLMSKHYRKNLYYNIDNLNIAKKSISRLYLCLNDLDLKLVLNKSDILNLKYFDDIFFNYINDDFNIHGIHKLLFNMLSEINKFKYKKFSFACKIGKRMKFYANFIGLLKYNSKYFLTKRYLFKKKNYIYLLKKINYLIEKRNIERKKYNWKEADYYRKKLYKLNVSIIDRENNESEWFFIN